MAGLCLSLPFGPSPFALFFSPSEFQEEKEEEKEKEKERAFCSSHLPSGGTAGALQSGHSEAEPYRDFFPLPQNSPKKVFWGGGTVLWGAKNLLP